ncbi:hypothetical protein N7507_003488 [Penicillium longicatenatum]|nr:hypothetical protein N7507_003488 [Penicillium longicatenatum]
MTSASFGTANSGFQVGVNQGSIYLSQGETNADYRRFSFLERSEPRFEPLSTVPFQRDPDFVRRDALFNQIHVKASIPGSRTVLVGLGGVGKTQLAIEYCHWVRQQSPETWAFWVHASNVARCEKSLRDLADRVEIPERGDRNANIFQLVRNWLQDKRLGKWILVLDNVDDDELLCKPLVTGTETRTSDQRSSSTQPPLRYLLENSNGSIIITSRSKGVAMSIAGPRNLIEVLPMEEAEALDLFQKKADIPAEREDMVPLVKALEFMPLAIVQAAAYITHRAPRCSISQYLEKLQKSDREAIRLLNHEAGLLHRDWEANNSILLTWQISFEHIHDVRPSAIDLLSLMSFFDCQGIPERILRVQQSQEILMDTNPGGKDNNSSEEDMGSISDSDTEQSFDDDISILMDFSFISISEQKQNQVLTVHRLMQLTMRAWLKTHGQLEKWRRIFINKLYYEFPTGQYENWEICRSLFPHVRSALSNRPESLESLEQWATLLYRGAGYALESGNIKDATEMALKSNNQRLKFFGTEDQRTLQTTNLLAAAYRDEGRWQEAEQLLVQVIETRKIKLCENHPDILSSMANLASIYREQGRWKEAELLQMEVMKTRKTKLSEDHPDTLTSMANLASIYWNQGRWEEAEQLEAQVLETRRTKLGEDHPDTLSSIANLASTYREQGRWDEAEQLEVKVIETRKTKLGEKHPDTISSMANLASTYWNQGRWEEAARVDVQVMETSKTKLGEDHPFTLTSMANLSSTYRKQGRWKEAEQLQVQVMTNRRTKLGENHPDTLSSMANLAWTYREEGRWKEAELLQIAVMETRKTKLGGNHPDTLSSMANLASTYWSQGRWKEAELLQVKVMETRRTKLGEDHPDTLSSMANLASTWKSTCRKADAVELLRTCVAKQQLTIGLGHPDTVSNSNTLLEWETEELSVDS